MNSFHTALNMATAEPAANSAIGADYSNSADGAISVYRYVSATTSVGPNAVISGDRRVSAAGPS